ncbi:MAG: hypothetical protein M0R51_11075 [Clostridia bacterium]|jgi:hypothetical protein|nr:hypothetical protein [Clostridia bacterium]
MFHKLYAKWKAYPTFKIYCNIAFIAETLVTIVVLKGWRAGLQDAPAIMQDDAIAFGCTIIAYTLKSGFEHSKLATNPKDIAKTAMQQIADHPVATAAISGLISSGGDLSSAASSAINAAQMEAEQQKEQQANYTDPSAAPPAENMPAENMPADDNNNMAG